MIVGVWRLLHSNCTHALTDPYAPPVPSNPSAAEAGKLLPAAGSRSGDLSSCSEPPLTSPGDDRPRRTSQPGRHPHRRAIQPKRGEKAFRIPLFHLPGVSTIWLSRCACSAKQPAPGQAGTSQVPLWAPINLFPLIRAWAHLCVPLAAHRRWRLPSSSAPKWSSVRVVGSCEACMPVALAS